MNLRITYKNFEAQHANQHTAYFATEDRAPYLKKLSDVTERLR